MSFAGLFLGAKIVGGRVKYSRFTSDKSAMSRTCRVEPPGLAGSPIANSDSTIAVGYE